MEREPLLQPPPPQNASSRNPQEPPSDSTAAKKRLPLCIYDLFFDIPHPSAILAAEATNNVTGNYHDTRARIIDPPVTICPLLAEEMYNPDNITRISRFAFPEFDDLHPDGLQDPSNRNRALLSSHGRTFGANLTKHDVYLVDFISHHHTFSMLLSDGKTRVHCHVRRYLPPHVDSVSRTDVGRRGPRAMVLVTRATGGERFYASVLKTLETIVVESCVTATGCFGRKKSPARGFLHSLFTAHAKLTTQYSELRKNGLNLNFTQIANTASLEGDSVAQNARVIMEQNDNLFRITLDKVEFGGAGKTKKGDQPNASNFHMENDILQFYLPFTLQPGFECISPTSIPEDMHSPIIPLLRYIGPNHLVRLLSALLCERRIILISKSITRLSMCVRAASSMMAQGLLLWRHIEIPVMPPFMIKFLAVKAPYLVGILEQHAPRLRKIDGLTDVLCVNVDTNELKTLNMENPRITVPDMLKKVSKKNDSTVGAAEMLANDLDEIFQADQKLWQHDDSANKGEKEKAKEVGVKAIDNTTAIADDDTASRTGKRTSIIGMMKRPTLKKQVTKAAQKIMSLEEKREYATSVDAAAAFGEMIRANFRRKSDMLQSPTDEEEREIDAPKYSAPSAEILGDIGSLEACTVAENEGGEEDARAALACFFIHLYGDMGMYLSETLGTFWLDRRKFLLRKKQLGELENSPMFIVLRKFSSSTMFETFVKGRIDDMSVTARERSSIMPHHIPLFDICAKYLSVNRLEFSLTNVRRIVARTVITCTRHIAVEKSIAVRTRALDLTADTPFDGNVAEALSDLVESCRECNTNLSVVLSVIWHRLGQTKGSMWRHQLLALHLLKNLLLHGPLASIAEALDGAEKVYELKSFSNAKSIDSNREVRQAADQCYDLLTDLSRLFLRRRRVAYAKAHQSIEAPKTKTWSDYLVGRLPFTMDARQLHALFRPEGVGVGVTYFEPNVALNHSINVNGLNTSLLALERLDGSLRNSRFGSQLMFDDEMEQYQDLGDDPDNLATHSQSSGHMNEAHYQEQYDEVEEEYNDVRLPKEKTLNEFDDEDFLKAFDSSFPGNSDHDSASLLQSFNNAASSHSGSYFSSNQSGSYFSSDHTGSYFSASGDEGQSSKPSKSRGVKKKSSGVGIQDQLRGFVFPEDEGGQGVIHEHDNESESRSNMSSYQDEDSHYDEIV